MALLGLAAHSEPDQRRRTALLMLGLAGAALFYGDGMITPAISVLSGATRPDTQLDVVGMLALITGLALLSAGRTGRSP